MTCFRNNLNLSAATKDIQGKPLEVRYVAKLLLSKLRPTPVNVPPIETMIFKFRRIPGVISKLTLNRVPHQHQLSSHLHAHSFSIICFDAETH